MPTALTFTSLQQDLRRYLERGEVTDPTVYNQLPRLINNAERECAIDLQILGFLTPAISAFAAGTSVYDKPDRWRSTASMNFGTLNGTDTGLLAPGNNRVQVYPRSLEYCRQYWPDSDARGVPKFYADYDYNHWLIVPTPVAAYPWEINTWSMPALLDDTNQTNWWTAYAPTTLLYRSLLECEPFLKQDDRIPVWKALYDDSKGKIDMQDVRRIVDRNTSRERN